MTTSFKYTAVDLQNPAGSNNLSPRAKFFQRSLYKEAIYPSDVVRPLDGWHDKNLFGRVDQDQYPIMCIKARLVPITRSQLPNVMALDFVNAAFSRLAAHMQNAFITNCIDRGGNPALFKLQAVLGYTDPFQKYRAHMRGLADAFITTYVPDPENPIKNFNDFKKEYIQYLHVMSEGIPITLSTFLLSTMVSPLISGLKIAIDRGNAGDDEAKYDQFVGDPNFLFYIQAAKKYGFLVDKNVPWMLTADLFSSAMLHYASLFPAYEGQANTSVAKATFFDTYYFRIYPTDVLNLATYIAEAYERYYTINPIYEEEKTTYRVRCPQAPLHTTVGHLAPPDPSDSLTAKETIDLYSKLRYMEVQQSGPRLEAVRRRAYELYRSGHQLELGVAKFINDSYQDFLYPRNYSALNPNFDVDKATRTDILDTVLEVASESVGGFAPSSEPPQY